MKLNGAISTRDIALAVALGVLAGVRASLPNALLGRAMGGAKRAGGRSRTGRSNGGASWLASRLGTRAMAAASVFELIGDKLPFVPDRVSLSPKLARIGSGGAAAASLARPDIQGMALLAVIGGASAALSTTLSFLLRRRAIRRWGLSSSTSGMIEDALVLAAAVALLPQLRGRAAAGNDDTSALPRLG